MAKIRCKYCGEPFKNSRICDVCGNEFDEESIKDYICLEIWLSEYNNSIRKKIQTGTPLDEAENEKFRALLNFQMLNYNDIDEGIIFCCHFNKRKILSYDTFKTFAMVMVAKTMEQIASAFGNNMALHHIEVFVKNLENNTLGQYNSRFNHYAFDTTTMKNLYEGDLYAFITLLHEMQHGIDDLALKSGCVSVLLTKILKDEIIISIDSKYNDAKTASYYKKNYIHIAGEIHAQQEAVYNAEYMFKKNGMKINPDFIEEVINAFDRDYLNQNRIVTIDGEEKIMTVDEIFDNIISDHPEFLDEYSQLNLEYVKDGDKVRRKTKKELKETLNSLEKEDAIIYIQSILNKHLS